MAHCNNVELSKDSLKRVTQAEKKLAEPDKNGQLLDVDVDIAAALTEVGYQSNKTSHL